MNGAAAGLCTSDERIAIPLAGVAVEADITGRSVRVEVTQTFVNGEEKAVEAVYRFPLPDGAALCGFRARVGEKVFEGEVDERDRAFDRYDQALEKGHGAYLLDEERPNIFTLSVGNLNPGVRADLTITYVETLEAPGGEVRFRLPTTISPRYLPADAPDEDGVPAGERIHPVYAAEVPYGLRLRIRVHGRDGIESVESPSHPVRCSLAANPVEVELAAESTRMDRDFVLLVRPRESARSLAWAGTAEGEGFVQVDFTLPAEDRPDTEPSGEVVFLLDCSGSMTGSSIDQARRGLGILLRALPPQMTFNLYRFGSRFQSLWTASRPATPSHVSEALAYLERAGADLGGTEILAPLRAIYAADVPGVRNVLLITDGQVGNEADVVALARSAPGRVRVFTVGIGHGPNDHLVRQTARVSGGASVLIAPGERIEPAVLGLFRKVTAAGVTDLQIELPGVEAAPRKACAFPEATVSLFGRFPAGSLLPSEVVVSGLLAGERRTWTVPVQAWDGARAPVPQLWAREAIRDLEDGSTGGSRQLERRVGATQHRTVELSKRYGVVCRQTSFLIVEEREDRDRTTGEVVLRRVPVPVTRGWHGMAKMECLNFDLEPSVEPLGLVRRERLQRQWAAPHVCRFEPDVYPSSVLISQFARASTTAKAEPEDVLFQLLAAQRPAGGFWLDEELCRQLGAPGRDLRQAAGALGMGDREAGYALACTAVALAFLEAHYPSQRDLWEPLVEKSLYWLQAAEATRQLLVDGQPLKEWAAALVATLPATPLPAARTSRGGRGRRLRS